MLDEAVCTPPGTPGPASSLLATSISLQALLAVADNQDTAAVTSYQMAVVDDVLRPLAIAIRESPPGRGGGRGTGAQRTSYRGTAQSSVPLPVRTSPVFIGFARQA